MAWGAQPRSRAWAASLVKAVGTSTLAGSVPSVSKVRAAAVSGVGPGSDDMFGVGCVGVHGVVLQWQQVKSGAADFFEAVFVCFEEVPFAPRDVLDCFLPHSGVGGGPVDGHGGDFF